MTKPASLKTLRKRAPRQDRAQPSLTPLSPPQPSKRFGRPLLASTLEDLQAACGEVIALDARWSAILTWIGREWEDTPLLHPVRVADCSVQLCKEHDRARFNYPTPMRRPWPDTLSKMSAESQEEAKRVAAATIEDWELAGRPFCGPGFINRCHQYYLSVTKGDTRQ